MAHLEKRFAPLKKYQWYFQSIVNLRMKQTETVSDYYDRVQGLWSGVKNAIEDKYTQVHYAGTTHEISESTIMMKPVVDCALDAFIRGLPDFISTTVSLLLSPTILCKLPIPLPPVPQCPSEPPNRNLPGNNQPWRG